MKVTKRFIVRSAVGTAAALASLTFVARLGTAKADAGLGYELFAITAVVLGGSLADYLLQGQAVFVSGPPGARGRMYGPGDRFLGVGQMTPEGRRLQPVRIMVDVADAAVRPGLA